MVPNYRVAFIILLASISRPVVKTSSLPPVLNSSTIQRITVSAGKAVFLPCQTRLVNISVDWYYKAHDETPESERRMIFEAFKIHENYLKEPRMSAQFDQMLGYYNLTLTGTVTADSGWYICHEDGGNGDRHVTVVSVLGVTEIDGSTYTQGEIDEPKSAGNGVTAGIAVAVVLTVVVIIVIVIAVQCRRRKRFKRAAVISIGSRIRRVNDELCKLMVCDKHLLQTAVTRGVITNEEYDDVYVNFNRLAYHRINRQLLDVLSGKREEKFQEFLDVLRCTDQLHIANYIVYGGCRSSTVGDEWPLDHSYRARLDANLVESVRLLKPTAAFVDALRHVNFLSESSATTLSRIENDEQRAEVLIRDILRRKSEANYNKFVDCLRVHQPYLVRLFDGEGVALEIGARLFPEDSDTASQTTATLVERLRQLFHGPRKQTLVEFLRTKFDLANIDPVDARRRSEQHSIGTVFYCHDLPSVRSLREATRQDRMKSIVQEVIDQALEETEGTMKKVVVEDVILPDKDCNKCESYLQSKEATCAPWPLGIDDEQDAEEGLDETFNSAAHLLSVKSPVNPLPKPKRTFELADVPLVQVVVVNETNSSDVGYNEQIQLANELLVRPESSEVKSQIEHLSYSSPAEDERTSQRSINDQVIVDVPPQREVCTDHPSRSCSSASVNAAADIDVLAITGKDELSTDVRISGAAREITERDQEDAKLSEIDDDAAAAVPEGEALVDDDFVQFGRTEIDNARRADRRNRRKRDLTPYALGVVPPRAAGASSDATSTKTCRIM